MALHVSEFTMVAFEDVSLQVHPGLDFMYRFLLYAFLARRYLERGYKLHHRIVIDPCTPAIGETPSIRLSCVYVLYQGIIKCTLMGKYGILFGFCTRLGTA